MNDQAGLRAAMGLMSIEEVSLLLDVTPHTLAMWRSEKKGPPFARLGRSIFYRRADVEAWIADNVVLTDSQAA